MASRSTVSIIIAVKNAKDLLAQTLASIRAQRYGALEVVVIDGLSTDGTVEIIKANQDLIGSWVSEPDLGISDAFNKGLQRATGEYINFQGAGDILVSPDCIEQLFQGVDTSYTLVCGQVTRVQEDGHTPIWVAPKRIRSFRKCDLLFKMPLPHQSLFTHRSFFEQFGGFDPQVRFAMDYEILLRAYHQFPKTIIKNVMISNWRAGGVGTNRIHEIFDEYHRIKTQHGVASQLTLKIIDWLTRLKYWLKTTCLKRAY